MSNIVFKKAALHVSTNKGGVLLLQRDRPVAQTPDVPTYESSAHICTIRTVDADVLTHAISRSTPKVHHACRPHGLAALRLHGLPSGVVVRRNRRVLHPIGGHARVAVVPARTGIRGVAPALYVSADRRLRDSSNTFMGILLHSESSCFYNTRGRVSNTTAKNHKI